MTWSLNEIEGLCRKAARGSGLSWGLAEDAGKAARWLAIRGLPGAELLARLLVQNDGAAYSGLCPVDRAGNWSATGETLCPVIAGAALSDRAAILAGGGAITLQATAFPLLLLPFAAALADQSGNTVEVKWPGLTALIAPGGDVELTKDVNSLTDRTDRVGIHIADAMPGHPRPHLSRVVLDDITADMLGALAQRTYAPDTPESRLAGAGAGLTDND